MIGSELEDEAGCFELRSQAAPAVGMRCCFNSGERNFAKQTECMLENYFDVCKRKNRVFMQSRWSHNVGGPRVQQSFE